MNAENRIWLRCDRWSKEHLDGKSVRFLRQGVSGKAEWFVGELYCTEKADGEKSLTIEADDPMVPNQMRINILHLAQEHVDRLEEINAPEMPKFKLSAILPIPG